MPSATSNLPCCDSSHCCCMYSAAKYAVITRNFTCLIRCTDITRVLAELVEGRKETAAGTGLAGARHAHSGSAGTDVDDVGAALDELIDRVKGLRHRTAEATLFLSAYDTRRAHEVGASSLMMKQAVCCAQVGWWCVRHVGCCSYRVEPRVVHTREFIDSMVFEMMKTWPVLAE